MLATPIWMGQACSLMQRVFERMDATFDEAEDDGRLWTFGKIAIACVVGNEDGAHHFCSQAYQALTDLGFTVPGGGGAYWVGEAMGERTSRISGPARVTSPGTSAFSPATPRTWRHC